MKGAEHIQERCLGQDWRCASTRDKVHPYRNETWHFGSQPRWTPPGKLPPIRRCTGTVPISSLSTFYMDCFNWRRGRVAPRVEPPLNSTRLERNPLNWRKSSMDSRQTSARWNTPLTINLKARK